MLFTHPRFWISNGLLILGGADTQKRNGTGIYYFLNGHRRIKQLNSNVKIVINIFSKEKRFLSLALASISLKRLWFVCVLMLGY